ncbi:MAG: SpoVG family protein [Clostridia bacterium]|nr:SpoVG family protein [Clostridia bacterium]
MKITEVAVRKLFNEGIMRAVVSVTFDDVFVVHDIKVLSIGERLLIVMPNRKNGDGTYRDVAHPILPSFRKELEAAVMEAYESACGAAAQKEEVSGEEPTTV